MYFFRYSVQSVEKLCWVHIWTVAVLYSNHSLASYECQTVLCFIRMPSAGEGCVPLHIHWTCVQKTFFFRDQFFFCSHSIYLKHVITSMCSPLQIRIHIKYVHVQHTGMALYLRVYISDGLHLSLGISFISFTTICRLMSLNKFCTLFPSGLQPTNYT